MINIVNSSNTQFIQRNLTDNIKRITEASDRLSSGKRINTCIR